jgi:glucose-1-phosphate thymidylyltransferase
MIPVGNQPIVERVLKAAIRAGTDEIVLVVGHSRERIQNHFGDGDDWGVPIRYVVQDHQLGAAHALSEAASVLEGPFMALHGDQPVSAELLERLCERYETTGESVVAVVQSDRPTEYGAVDVDAEQVVSVAATPTTEPPFLVNAGAYVFGDRVFEAIEATDKAGEFGMAAALQWLADADALSAVVHRGNWCEVTHPWDLLATNAHLLHGRAATPTPDGVDETAVVAADVAIDETATVGPNTTLLPGTSLDRSVRVGANAVLSNCIVMAGAEIGDGAVLHDCIVGEAVEIGPNVTAEGGPARVVATDAVYDDVEFGGLVADRSRLRGNVTVTPGTVVGRDVTADCGTVLRGEIASGETVRRG